MERMVEMEVEDMIQRVAGGAVAAEVVSLSKVTLLLFLGIFMPMVVTEGKEGAIGERALKSPTIMAAAGAVGQEV
jgi:hypothetical protein